MIQDSQQNLEFDKPSAEMIQQFHQRTALHIKMVRGNLIQLNGFLGLEEQALLERSRTHDRSKYKSEEKKAYTWLTWQYYQKSIGNNLNLPSHIKKKIHHALKDHSKMNRHHPEYHKNLNDMTLLDMAEMICDWTAIAKENNSPNNSCRQWVEQNLDEKWSFPPKKKNIIYQLINELDRRNKASKK